jgi:hypothetical protein
VNDPEVTMPATRQHSTLIAHSKALEAAGTAIRLVMRVPAPLKSIAAPATSSTTATHRCRRRVEALTWRLLHPHT